MTVEKQRRDTFGGEGVDEQSVSHTYFTLTSNCLLRQLLAKLRYMKVVLLNFPDKLNWALGLPSQNEEATLVCPAVCDYFTDSSFVKAKHSLGKI